MYKFGIIYGLGWTEKDSFDYLSSLQCPNLYHYQEYEDIKYRMLPNKGNNSDQHEFPFYGWNLL